MSAQRKMAVILAGDVVGYSRLIGADEEGTIARLKALQREVVRPMVAAHRGRVVKTTGDGILVEFASVVDALRCAAETQIEMRKRGAAVPEDRRIVYRIGINLGDVVVDGDDLLGDGVNVAARVEGLCEPGGIAVTRAVHDQAQGKLPLTFEDRGEHEVKNIVKPVRVYAARFENYVADAQAQPAPFLSRMFHRRVAIWSGAAALVVVAAIIVDVTLTPPPEQPAPVLPRLPASIAPLASAERAALIVLPFANISGDPSQEYFSDGITEDITTSLARIPGFLVMARNTAFTYKGKPVNAQSIGRELGVRYLLEGSVQKQGDRLRMNAQLIETSTGNHVWAERYDRAFAEVFAVQDELADKIVGTVAAHLRRREGERALAAPPEKLEAYELTMRARLLRRANSKEETLEAQRLLLQAIDRDPSYAPAHARLADVFNQLLTNSWTDEYASLDTPPRMLAESSRAVALAPSDPYARAVHGLALRAMNQYDAALTEVDQALALAPNDADILSAAGTTTSNAGQFERAIEITRRQIALDPIISPGAAGSTMAVALIHLGRCAEAADLAQACTLRAPSNTNCRVAQVVALGLEGKTSEARAAAAELLRFNPGFTISERARVYRMIYRLPEAAERMAEGLRKAGVPE